MIQYFDGFFEFLSNFAWSPFEFHGKTYNTVEHAYQAFKTVNEEDHEWIRTAPTPNIAKKRGSRRGEDGRKITLRPDWESKLSNGLLVKDFIMLTFLRIKFSDMKLQSDLLDTEDAYLEEGNSWHDNYWGDCKCARCWWKGSNKLGLLLMQVRSEIVATRMINILTYMKEGYEEIVNDPKQFAPSMVENAKIQLDEMNDQITENTQVLEKFNEQIYQVDWRDVSQGTY